MLYYEDCREGLGLDFYESVAEAIESIADTPLLHPIYEGAQLSREFHRVRLERFPYIIVYEIRENETLIIAVAHSSQQAGYWAGRPE
jgi:hypothetical protein